MNTPAFLAWSLFVAGVFALSLMTLRRWAVAKHGSLPTMNRTQSALMAVTIFLLGAQLTVLIGKAVGDMPLASITRLSPGALVLMAGLINLNTMREEDDTLAWQQVLGVVGTMLGVLILAMETLWP